MNLLEKRLSQRAYAFLCRRFPLRRILVTHSSTDEEKHNSILCKRLIFRIQMIQMNPFQCLVYIKQNLSIVYAAVLGIIIFRKVALKHCGTN